MFRRATVSEVLEAYTELRQLFEAEANQRLEIEERIRSLHLELEL